MRRAVGLLLTLVLVATVLGGCRAGGRPKPALDFTLEQQGESLVVQVSIEGLKVPEQGHVHLFLDDGPETMAYSTTYQFPKVAPGLHKVRVELSDLAHRNLGVSLTKEIEMK